MNTGENSEGLIKYQFHDGYETGGLLYFRFECSEMVAVIRERSQFDQNRERGMSLQDYIDSTVSFEVYGAGLALDKQVDSGEEAPLIQGSNLSKRSRRCLLIFH